MSNNFDPSRFFNAGFNFGGQDQQQQAPPPTQQQQQQQQAFQQAPPHHVGGGGGPPPPQQQQQPTMTDQQRQMLMMSMALGGNGNGNPNANANVMAAVLSQLGPQHQNLTPQQMQAIMQQWRFNPGNFAAAGAASAAAQNGNGGQQQQQQQGQQPRPPPPSSSSSIPIQQSPNLQHQFQQQQQQQQFAALQQQQQRQQQQQQLAHQQQPNQPPSQGGPSNNKSGGGFPPAAISGAQAASAASQAAAFNRQQQQQQGFPPGFNQHFGQQQQPSPQINNMAPGGQLQGQLPSQISQLAVNITDEQLRSWQDKEKHGHFSDQQKAQLAMIVRLREELKGKAQPEQQQAGPSQPRPPPAQQQQQQQQGAMRPPQPQQGGFPSQPVQGGAQANPMMAAQNQMQQPQRGAWPNGNQQGPPHQHAARMGPPPQAQQQQRQGPPQGAGVNMQNYQMGGAGIRPPPQQQQQQQQQGGPSQLSDSANKALLVEAAARDPKKLFLTFAERLKALEARINHPQTSEADRQSARQQMAGSKDTFQSVINELTSTGKLPPGFQSAANAVMSNPSALAHQMQQQQQQQQQAAQQGQGQQQQHQQGTPTLATRTPAAVGQMFSPPTVRAGHQAGSSPNAFASPALNAQQTTPHLQNAAAFGQQVPPQQQHQQPQAANARPPQQQQQWNVGAGVANAQPQAQPANSLFPLNQENFMRVLTDLLPRRGVTLKQPVMVGGHPIDLWTLYQTVSERNGMQAVSANSAWPAVVVAIGLAPHGSPEAYTLAQPLADAYRTYLMPFEGLWKHAAATMANQRANQQQQQQASQMGGGGQQQAQPGPQGQSQHQQPPGPGQMNARPPPSAQQLAALQMQQQQQLQQQQGRFAQPPQAPAPQQQQQQVGPPTQAGQLPRPPPPTLSQAQIQQLGIDQERFNEMWRAGSFQPPAAAAAAANNGANPARPPPGQQAAMQMQAPQQQQQPQMPNQQQTASRPAPSPAHQPQQQPQQQPQPQPSAPFQPGTNGQGQASPPAPRPSGGDPSRQITKENFEAAKERLLKIDEELALNRPGLKDPRPVSDEERKQIFAFVGSLSVLSEETHVLMPALGAMMGNDFEAAGGRKAKLMLWLLRDQMWFMRSRNECRFGLEDIRRMAYQFKKLTDYVKTGNPQIAEYLLKDHAARRMAGAPSWFSLQPPFPSSYPDAPTQGQSQSRPQTGPTAAPAAPPAGSLPVDEATAAQMGIKRGLRVDDLKLPPSKRKTTGGGTPGTPTNQGSSPTGMPLDASPAAIKVGDSPKPMTGGASPPSSSGARGGKRGASTAAARGGRGKKARGGGAAGLSSSQDDAIAASPKPKAKTSADIMAEVKAEMAAEAERKRREEADRAAAGIEDPARNPFLLAEEAAKKEAQARAAGGQGDGDELDYVMNAWQDMLDAGQAGGGAGGAPVDGSWQNPLQSMLALVGASPAAVAAAGQTTAAAASSAPAPASQTAPSTLSQLPDTDIFFDFDSFDGHEEDVEAPPGERDPREEVATALGLVPFAPHATAPKTDEAGTVTTSSGTMGETPDLVSSSSSGIPSAASSSTSSSAVLPQATFAHFFDENGFVLGTGGVNGSSGKPAMVSSPMQSSPTTADSAGSRSSSLAGAVGGLGLEDDSFWDADHAQLYAKDQESAWAILPGMPS